MATSQHAQTAEDRLERLLAMQSLLARVSREIGPALELEGVLSTVLKAVRVMISFGGGTIQLVDEGGVFVGAADPPVSPEILDARVPIGTGLSGRVVSTGQSIYSPNIQCDPRVDPALRSAHSNTRIRSYLAVPLVVLGSVIGVLQIDSGDIDAFDDDDKAVLEGLAVQVAGAIESARRRQDLLEIERMKSDFIARISHELRTPLTVIGGFTDTLITHGDRLDAGQQREVLMRIKTSVGRLGALIEEILNVSSLDAGLSRVESIRVDVAPLLRESAQLSIDESRVSLDCDADRQLVTDPVILRHVVNQLVDNALKYACDAVVSCGSDP
ncbi:MAG: GAF domain-containing protein, partial [Acidimicrobiales bacterium]